MRRIGIVNKNKASNRTAYFTSLCVTRLQQKLPGLDEGAMRGALGKRRHRIRKRLQCASGGGGSLMVLPLVSDADRQWAMKQCPHWASVSFEDEDGEIVDDGNWLDGGSSAQGRLPKPNWADFVHEQAERFEKYFGYQQKTYGDWSALWRKAGGRKLTP